MIRYCEICKKPVGNTEYEFSNAAIYHVACAMEQFGLSPIYTQQYEQAKLTRERQINEQTID